MALVVGMVLGGLIAIILSFLGLGLLLQQLEQRFLFLQMVWSSLFDLVGN